MALGKTIVVFGLIIAAFGFVVWMLPSVPILSRLGRLPGDILVRRGNVTFYFPLVTSLVISIVLSIVVAFVRR